MNSAKKKQHYLPQFYLRSFSNQSNKKQLGIYIPETNFYHASTKLKTQAYEKFYYGKDGEIENRLADIENDLSKVFNAIIQKEILPIEKSVGHTLIMLFMILTQLRNPKSIDRLKHMNTELEKRLIEIDPSANINKLVPKISHDEVVELSLGILENGVSVTADLGYKLIINKTKIPFLTSDNPIAKYNQFLIKKKWPFSKTGFATVGLQVFIPLSPNHMLIFYDKSIYKIGYRKRSTFLLTNIKDVNELNTLQFVNCYSTIYFNEMVTENYLNKLNVQSCKFKKSKLINSESSNLINKDSEISPDQNTKKNLIIFSTQEYNTNLSLSFLKFHSGSKKITLDQKVIQMRKTCQIDTR